MSDSAHKLRRMAGPLSEGLRVRHIANLSLVTCESSDDTTEVLMRPDLAEFDQIGDSGEGER